jgi:hypothetical protein
MWSDTYSMQKYNELKGDKIPVELSDEQIEIYTNKAEQLWNEQYSNATNIVNSEDTITSDQIDDWTNKARNEYNESIKDYVEPDIIGTNETAFSFEQDYLDQVPGSKIKEGDGIQVYNPTHYDALTGDAIDPGWDDVQWGKDDSIAKATSHGNLMYGSDPTHASGYEVLNMRNKFFEKNPGLNELMQNWKADENSMFNRPEVREKIANEFFEGNKDFEFSDLIFHPEGGIVDENGQVTEASLGKFKDILIDKMSIEDVVPDLRWSSTEDSHNLLKADAAFFEIPSSLTDDEIKLYNQDLENYGVEVESSPKFKTEWDATEETITFGEKVSKVIDKATSWKTDPSAPVFAKKISRVEASNLPVSEKFYTGGETDITMGEYGMSVPYEQTGGVEQYGVTSISS